MHKWVFVLMMLGLPPAWAQVDDVQRIAEKLRCLVCQNQSIAESDAPLAQDLRRQVGEQLAQGKSEKEVLAFMVARYGDFVLYSPPMKPATWPLWFGPFALLFGGLVFLYRTVRGNSASARD